MERLCVFTKDICDITGKELRYAQKLLQTLKILHQRQKHQYITKKELAEYLGLDPEQIKLR